jgi:hypothetical protein
MSGTPSAIRSGTVSSPASRVSACARSSSKFSASARARISRAGPPRAVSGLLTAAHDTVDLGTLNECKVRIEADGPFGPIEPAEYVIITNGLQGSRAAPLRTIALALRKISEDVAELKDSVKKQRLVSRILPQSRDR